MDFWRAPDSNFHVQLALPKDFWEKQKEVPDTVDIFSYICKVDWYGKNFKCYLCGKEGHIKRRCPSKGKRARQNSPVRRNSEEVVQGKQFDAHEGSAHNSGINATDVNANAHTDEEEDPVSVIIEEAIQEMEECMQEHEESDVFGPKPRCAANNKKGVRCKKNAQYIGNERTQFCRHHTPAIAAEEFLM